ncbi:sensory box/GGDEF family protein [Candidatus Magnetobacterium bavaricum]|uniref:diguanylate cyclase n=1 Tax=Candidatus Magnetobacterium bavaricum TaxID=29290 RepID=A0A0F3GV17_9BACT|nr:sensory box/GGDEF family protein [Candidatus Magnetobacterium bavaricum]
MVVSIDDLISRAIIDSLNTGIVVIDLSYNVVLYNSFMVKYSETPREEILGRNLFDIFPYLPKGWLELKFKSVQILKGYSFISWKHRAYLFKFHHNRPITGDVDYMFQDCTFLPILDENAQVTSICIIVQDMTDIAISQKMIDEVLDANKMLQQLSYYDGLTGIYNRLYIEKLLEKEFDKASAYNTPFSVVMFDLDHFKRVNDTYGHLAGDDVLKSVAKTVGNHIRQTDVLGRYGGEEFLIIVPDMPQSELILFCQQIRASVEKTAIQYEEIEIMVTLSIGIATYRGDMRDYFQVIHEADIALYQSKKLGRNRVTAYADVEKVT